MAGLVHDTVEDTTVELSDLEQLFGEYTFSDDGVLYEVFTRFGLPPEEWPDIIDALSSTPDQFHFGRLNINEASYDALLALPGVDEAIAGHCSQIDVTLHSDGAVEVADNGRGMPVDEHPGEKISGVEVILTRLHAGGKFSRKNYKYSGGLHGVGVSVVNALSAALEIRVKRGGKEYGMAFAGGEATNKLRQLGSVGARNSGTSIRFTPDPRYFDTVKLSLSRLRHLLRAKAVLCPGLRIRLRDEASGERDEWLYDDGLTSYLSEALAGADLVPAQPFMGKHEAEHEAVTWALQWASDDAELITESYVNLVPTLQGGTHVGGLRQGLLEAMREFCDIRSLLPRGLKLAPDDIWDRCCHVLSSKLEDPQFSGQTKERLSSREAAAFISGVAKDAFSLWLNQHT